MTILYGLKGRCHNVSILLRMPSNWLKIPKSVIVTDFPLSSFRYLMYLAEMCCDSKDVFLVGILGQDPVILPWVWWVLLALFRSLNLRHSLCGFLYNHLYCPPTTPLQVRHFSCCDCGDCGDKIPSKSRPQSAGITSCAISEILLNLRCFLVILSSNVHSSPS